MLKKWLNVKILAQINNINFLSSKIRDIEEKKNYFTFSCNKKLHVTPYFRQKKIKFLNSWTITASPIKKWMHLSKFFIVIIISFYIVIFSKAESKNDREIRKGSLGQIDDSDVMEALHVPQIFRVYIVRCTLYYMWERMIERL